MYVVFVYDVTQNRRRTRLFKRLRGVLQHVQLSVFEGEVPDKGRAALEELASRYIDGETDQVRIYTLCRACRGATRLVGRSVAVGDPREPIIV